MGVPVLETERLRLRGWRDGDLEPMARIASDPEVMRFMHSGPLSREQSNELIESLCEEWAERGFGHWAVEERESGVFVGHVGLHHHDDWPEDPDNVEVGWWLDRPWWGRGLATEAARVALHFGFETVRAPEIISITDPAHAASRRVMEKIGLGFAGTTTWRGEQCVYYALRRP